jgi:hypothetical protein
MDEFWVTTDESPLFYWAALAPSNQPLVSVPWCLSLGVCPLVSVPWCPSAEAEAGSPVDQKKAQPVWLRRIHQRRRVEETNSGSAEIQQRIPNWVQYAAPHCAVQAEFVRCGIKILMPELSGLIF